MVTTISYQLTITPMSSQHFTTHFSWVNDVPTVPAVEWIPGSYGNFLRAWRLGLSPNDSVTISRTQFLTACSNLGFKDAGKAPWPSDSM